MKNKIVLLLLIIFVIHLLFRVYEYRGDYVTVFKPEYWKLKYENSQWNNNNACADLDPHINPYTCVWDDVWYDENKNNPAVNDLKKNAIGDDALYTYAGWEYIHGSDPTLLNAEVPPFGKYLIGVSELIFKNQAIFALLIGLFSLYAFYLVNTIVFKSKLYAFLPVFLLSFEPIFYTQLRTPLLDLLYLSLFLMTIYFFIKKKFMVSAVFLGFMAATKSAASTFPLVIGVFICYILLTKQYHLFKKYLVSIPIAGVVFVSTYTQYFLLGHNFLEFLGVQKWIINFYTIGAKGSVSAPWEILFTGKYANWWGQTSLVSEWHIGWVFALLLTSMATYFVLRERHKSMVTLLWLWVVIYIIFLSFVPVWSRYFLLILPFMYTLSLWTIVRIFKKDENI